MLRGRNFKLMFEPLIRCRDLLALIVQTSLLS
jgi:hypothetical protein